MKSKNYTEEEFIEAVATSPSIRQVLFKLGLATEGGSYATVKRNVKRLKLDTSHWTGQGHNKGKFFPRRSIWDYLVIDGPEIQSSSLRQRLLKEGLLENRCYLCNLPPEWENKPLTLHLDHINGNHKDNRLKNLRILCPNCHNQTETFCLGNKRSAKRDRPSKSTRMPLLARETSPIIPEENKKAEKIKNYCPSCNKEILPHSKSCKKCISKKYKIDWPSTPDLEKMLKESNYTQIGKKLGVSDNAVRKRLRNHPV